MPKFNLLDKDKTTIISGKLIVTTLGFICILCGVLALFFNLASITNTHHFISFLTIASGLFCLLIAGTQK